MGKQIQKLVLGIFLIFLCVGCGANQESSAYIQGNTLSQIVDQDIKDSISDTEESNDEVISNEQGDSTTNQSGQSDSGNGSQTGGNSGQGNGSTGGTGGTTDKSTGGSNNSTTTNKKYVTITVECSTILNNKDKLKSGYENYIPSNGIVVATTKIEIQDGMTVLEVLQKVSKVNAQGGYVEAIDDIAEFCCGGSSGWMYGINGTYVNKGASKQTVKNGDTIRWVFTCANGKDVTF